jgi:diphthamide biosynthesis enzyme Dph1/Dph2-like protein
MKKLFIEAKRKNLELNSEIKKFINKQEKFYLFYSIQYFSLAQKIKKFAKNKLLGFQQILGCSKISTNQKAPVLLVGSGKFHALQLSLQISSPLYIIEESKITKLDEKQAENLKKKRKSAIMKFLLSDKTGILVSTKKHQYNLETAEKIKQKLMKNQKKSYILIAETISPLEIENFPLPVFINTACTGLILDSGKIINYSEIMSYL